MYYALLYAKQKKIISETKKFVIKHAI